jgi:hypothetical protein
MRIRILITLIWIVSFMISLVIVLSYFKGGTILTPDDNVGDYVHPVITLYGPYIVGILTFWFIKPFPYSSLNESVVFRYWLAVGLTLFFNVLFLYFVGSYYIKGRSVILTDIKNGVQICAWLSILVGSVNAYLFGMKSQK